MPDQNEIDLDVIMDELGSYGRFQVEVFVYLAIPIMVKAIYNTNFVFTAGYTKYRCLVPQCESTPPVFRPGAWGAFALPGKGFNCYRKVAIGSTCEPSSFSNKLEKCSSWIYENHYSIVYDYELACQEWKRTLVGTMHSFAYFTALPALAYFSDAWGRGRVFIFTAIVPAFFGSARAFVNDYYWYLVLEYFEAFVGCGTFSTGFIMGVEMVSISNRVRAGILIGCLFAIGQSSTGLIAYLWPYWRTFTLVAYTPSFLFFVYLCIYKESLRWLIGHGHKKKAIKVILRAARINNKQLSAKTLASLKADSDTDVKKDDGSKDGAGGTVKKPLWKRVLKSKIMLFRICICSYAWVTMNLIYYGLSINSVSLAGSRYLNFAISSLIEIPGTVIGTVTLDTYGRKKTICVAYILCGLSLMSTWVTSKGTIMTSLTMFGKLCISLISCATYIYTIELFPTEARHSLLGICSMVGRFGSMLAPQTPLLIQSSSNLPNLVFGIMSMVAGVLLLKTPETLNRKLPDTIEQAENLNIMPNTLKRQDALI